jgi:methylenetetrahydrofolate dehydrogenase (NADP+)/methenyltetrahydrofolate cyclohydrolase
MFAHDGAKVYSFDIDGVLTYQDRSVSDTSISRAEALAESDAVVTGVPSHDFPLIRARELKRGVVVVNFSTCKNVDDDVIEVAQAFLPRVGPITVAMLLRNTLRLFTNFHAQRGV